MLLWCIKYNVITVAVVNDLWSALYDIRGADCIAIYSFRYVAVDHSRSLVATSWVILSAVLLLILSFISIIICFCNVYCVCVNINLSSNLVNSVSYFKFSLLLLSKHNKSLKYASIQFVEDCFFFLLNGCTKWLFYKS